MPIRRPDTYRHNNSDLPIVLPFDWQVGAGVSVIADLYNIPPDKINIGGQVYVESQNATYKLINKTNITTSSGWELMYSATQAQFESALQEKLDVATYQADKHFKGLFTSEANLIAATSTMDPAPKSGDYAKVDQGVGSDAVKYIWDDNDSKWVIGGGSGTVESVNGVSPDVQGNVQLDILSAYDIWISEGNVGTVQDYLNSLIGNGIQSVTTNGDGTFTLNFTDGTTYTTQNLTGPQGDSAYQVWLSLGNTGTEQDFIDSLEGPAGQDGQDLEPYSSDNITTSRNILEADRGKTLIIGASVTLTFSGTYASDLNLNILIKAGQSLTIANGDKTLKDSNQDTQTQIVVPEKTFCTIIEFEPGTYIVLGL